MKIQEYIPPPIITLTTDFDDKDAFSAIMKGVILSINPKVTIVDITHRIPPQDIWQAAFIIRNFYLYFPKNTIHVAVVDPGVGSERLSLLITTKWGFYIGPDNGIFSLALRENLPKKIIKIENKDYMLKEVSSTFHGRDIFAPVSAYLSLGKIPETFGSEIKDFFKLPWTDPIIDSSEIRAKIIHIDTFGNIITNISQQLFREKIGQGRFQIIMKRNLKIEKISVSYQEGKIGEPLAIFGSSGFLEISLKNDNASAKFGIMRGDEIVVYV
ncbi:MAG: SAM-dependent chlorinase/fluorinase [Thermodesulfobacteriota bacterium]|nr:SAM-dependent chlorinase/fluorinase [Thermodesulfobacteriota bacterium]